MKDQTCCFTGHRDIPKTNYGMIQICLERIISDLASQGVRYFKTGGALGFDTIAALIVLKFRKKFPHIRLILVLPYKEQAENWSDSDKKIYGEILENADKVVYTSKHYHNGCMHKRNRHLVDKSGACICYLVKDSGGTSYTVDYARKKGLKIINIA